MKITYEDIKNNEEFKIYVEKGNEMLGVLGYTDHSAAHTVKVGEAAANILLKLGYSHDEAELAKIAGYIHDIGNVVNRQDHSQTGAVMAFTILTNMGMEPTDIAFIVSAIGNHDENAGIAVTPISAAIIIADKTDVRRSRVRNRDFATFDIHDRVNYAVVDNQLVVEEEKRKISLHLTIDTEICSVMDYFEIFLTRMLMCKRSAEFLNATFKLSINNSIIL